MKTMLKLFMALLLGLFIGACSSGGGSSDTSVTGTFVDDPVEGLNYTCSSGATGVTNADGQYSCSIGDNVTFSIGTVNIGTIVAQTEIITPYSFFPGDLDSALNLARLLQSIDSTPDDGLITLNPTLVALLPVSTDFSSVDFENDVETALGVTLVSIADALTQLNAAIVSEGGDIPDGANIPVANAGPDQNVLLDSTVTLDGSASTDADGDALTYSWRISEKPLASTAELVNSTQANPTFTADLNGTYVIELLVNDTMANSAPDTVTITAYAANVPPVADAGADQVVGVPAHVTLNGSASSDANGDLLTYTWSVVSSTGTTVALSDATAMSPSFEVDTNGTYVLQLIVNDGTVDSEADTVTITATSANVAPVANAGADQDVNTTATVSLDGSGSLDADSDLLTYSWSIINVPTNSTAMLSSSSAVNPSFTADKEGTYVIQLIVNDGTVDSDPDTVTITATTVLSGIVHNGTSYGTLTSPTTSRIWLDRNLGATQVCTAYYDTSCYGDYYQWGRNYDGHQSASSAITSVQATNVTDVGHGNFITSISSKQYDWGFDADANGATRVSNWSAIDGSSVCPSGYRVPTKTELQAETGNFLDHTDAFNSFLKLPTGGTRYADTGAMDQQGSIGYLWTSSTDNLGTSYNYWSSSLYYYNLDASISADVSRGGGIAVRCIKN
ncbi:MAG: PKD domain-containing protein [Sulfurimonas sp.]|nr:PKD domain-containing protein [Sulfurimonas sp.]